MTASQPTIRAEGADDVAAIRALVVAAFRSSAEGDLVDNIRASDRYLPDLSLVAEHDGEIVGHVMISGVDVVDGERVHAAHSLSPLAVRPDCQGRGIGSALVRDVVQRADERGVPLVLVEGSPEYYGRLGFVHSVELGIEFDLPDWAPATAAQAHPLTGYDPALRGRVRYPPAFDAR